MFEAGVILRAQTDGRRVLCESLRVRLPRSSLPRPTTNTGARRSAARATMERRG
jgi:hypothetical protein